MLSWSWYLVSAAVWLWHGLANRDKNIYLPCIGWILLMFIRAVPYARTQKKSRLCQKHRQKCHKFHRWLVLLRESMRMSDDENKDEGISAHTGDCHEAIASQEETHLEEAEENLRAIPTSYKPSRIKAAENLEEQLDHAAEELITGDSDDAPLSEEAVAEALRMTLNARRSDG